MRGLLNKVEMQKAEALGIYPSQDGPWKFKIQYLDMVRTSTIDFDILALPEDKIIFAQSVCLHFLEIEAFENETFTTPQSYEKCKTFLFILEVLHREHPTTRISDLTLDQLNSSVCLLLFTRHAFDSTSKYRKLIQIDTPRSKQQLEKILSAIKLWHNLFLKGHVSDGPSYLLTSQLLMPLLRSVFENIDVDVSDWAQGGTFGSIPFVICHLLLADALETLDSLKAKKLLAYFSIVQSGISEQHISQFWSSSNNLPWKQYRLSSNIEALEQRIEFCSTNSQDCLEKFARPLHCALLDIHPECDLDIFPWRTYPDLCNDYREVVSALLVTFLSVMGKRGPSEVGTLRANDIQIPADGVAEYASVHPAIFKTHSGQRLSHGITGYIDHAFLLALSLGNINKSDTHLPLFSAPPSLRQPFKPPRRLSSDRLNAYLHDYYASFAQRASEKVDFDIMSTHPKLTSHQFRHCFAEFALRKYDGNVEELLRQHFVHAFDHWWTKKYTADKLDEDRIQRLNSSYIRELIPHIALDSCLDPDYVGGVALYIRSIIDEHVLSMPPHEIEKHINSLSEQISSITPHEYGWCIVFKKFSAQAKCADSSGCPAPTNTTHLTCTGCINFCASKKSHLDYNTKVVISHLDFLEQKTWIFREMKELSRTAVRNAQKLFPELRSLGTPHVD